MRQLGARGQELGTVAMVTSDVNKIVTTYSPIISSKDLSKYKSWKMLETDASHLNLRVRIIGIQLY